MKDYTKYSYDETVQKMTELLKNAEGWGDGYQSSMGQTLIQLMADVTDNLNYMLERRVEESYIDHARLRTSVIARASELGYRYKTTTPNYGEVVIKIDDDKGLLSDIYIKPYTKLEFDGDTFYTTSVGKIPSGEEECVVNIIMGEYSEMTVDDSPEGPLIRNFDNIIMQTFFVEDADGVVFSDVFKNSDAGKRSLSYVGDEPYYDLRYTVNGLRIVFGDGKNGKKPKFPLRVTFLEATSTDPIMRVGVEFSIEDVVVDSDGEDRKLLVESLTRITGYSPPESTESIRNNAPDYHKTNLRAVTNSDYGYWAKNSGIGHIIDAKAYGEEETGGLLFTANNVFLTYLTESGGKLSANQERELRDYLDIVKTSQAHVVMTPADILRVIVDLRVKKNKKNPSANDEIFSILRKYLIDATAPAGFIGGRVHASDIIRGLYDLRSFRNDAPHELIEYAAIDIKADYPFSYPQKTNTTFISLDESEFPSGSEWVIHFDGVPCVVKIKEGDTPSTTYTKMRQEIIKNTDMRARVVVRSLTLENEGIPTPIEIDNYVGTHRIIGVPSLYTRDTMIDVGSVGTSIIDVRQKASNVEVEHRYYSSERGNRPAIPLRIDTKIEFTAPCDTQVNVWSYNDFMKPDERIILDVIPAGGKFEYTSTFEHVIQFEYKDDSTQDAFVYIDYSNYMTQATYGILVDTYDDIGTFVVESKSGDYKETTMIEYNYRVPVLDQNKEISFRKKPAIHRGSLQIVSGVNEVLYLDDGKGEFVTPTGGRVGGGIDYMRGNIRLPIPMREGDYSFRFYQDDMESITVDDTTAIQFVKPKVNYTDEEETESTIRID